MLMGGLPLYRQRFNFFYMQCLILGDYELPYIKGVLNVNFRFRVSGDHELPDIIQWFYFMSNLSNLSDLSNLVCQESS